MAKKPTPTEVEIECVVDRLPLENGHVLIFGQTGTVPAAHADNYIAAGKAKRV